MTSIETKYDNFPLSKGNVIFTHTYAFQNSKWSHKYMQAIKIVLEKSRYIMYDINIMI